MKLTLIIATLLFASTALAEEMDQATKVKMLRRAWQLNGCSMERVGAIDLTRYDLAGNRLADMSDMDWDTFIHSIPTLITQPAPTKYPPAIGGGVAK